MAKGKLVVIEGTDGAGKTTQIKLLKQYLASQGRTLQVIDFPRYKDNEYGKLVKRYLLGEFGSLENVNPYLASLAYGGDRMLAGPLIKKWVEDGLVVITNRYVASNKAHMSVKLPKNKRQNFVKWLDNLEYKVNQVPRENLTILLYVDPKIAQENLKARGRVKDIHEVDLRYQQEVAAAFLSLAKKEKYWVVVNCARDKKMKPAEKIHSEIMKILKGKGIL